MRNLSKTIAVDPDDIRPLRPAPHDPVSEKTLSDQGRFGEACR
ncbi:hypothetical protein BV133_498 [Blastochloris viridis]|uniref:Uncharacterized protein n=1 Tax=Blastochloris viridis TaxID=1079 RepID=A0A182CZP7_BLAVI|nr:hypothetical protein BV133_498 [Blastochloris viridis]